MLSTTLATILGDKGFQVPSPRAQEALVVTKKLFAWCQDENNKQQYLSFELWLVSTLKTCFEVSSKVARLRNEKIWEKYHQLRISGLFKEEWNKFFLVSLSRPALPTVFQSISHRVFKCLLEEEFKVEEHKRLEGISCAITWEEENGLRYFSGYVCRKVQQKIGVSNLKTKEEMIQLCVELCGDEDSDRGTEEWTNTIDRGGLWHVNDNT